MWYRPGMIVRPRSERVKWLLTFCREFEESGRCGCCGTRIKRRASFPARTDGPETSLLGALNVDQFRGTLRCAVLLAYADGRHMNSYEVHQLLQGTPGFDDITCTHKRINELVYDFGFLVYAGYNRPGGRTTPQKVYRITRRGKWMLRVLRAQ